MDEWTDLPSHSWECTLQFFVGQVLMLESAVYSSRTPGGGDRVEAEKHDGPWNRTSLGYSSQPAPFQPCDLEQIAEPL